MKDNGDLFTISPSIIPYGIEISHKAVEKRGVIYQDFKPVFQALMFFVYYE